jgi:hypothetical protein
VVLAYLDALTRLGHTLMEGIALSLGLDAAYFADRYTADPLILIRIFNYPSRSTPAGQDVQWGVGEHTDYGLLTILRQDDIGGLQVRTAQGWIDAAPVPDSFVINIGDMLDRMTGGLYRSTPHRVALNTSGRDRLSMPFFFDPHFEARVLPIAGLAESAAAHERVARWDGANIHAFDGTYGDYLLGKVSKVFPGAAPRGALASIRAGRPRECRPHSAFLSTPVLPRRFRLPSMRPEKTVQPPFNGRPSWTNWNPRDPLLRLPPVEALGDLDLREMREHPASCRPEVQRVDERFLGRGQAYP